MTNTQPGRIRVAVVEKRALYRESLRLLLEHSGLDVVGTAGDAGQAIALSRQVAPDVLLIDPSIEGLNLDRLLDTLNGLEAPPRTLLLADEAWVGRATRAILRGAHGVFSKDDDCALLVKGISGVAAGQYWVGRKSVSDVVEFARRELAPRNHEPRGERFGLTRRKLEIIAAILAGRSNREIASALSLSEQTIKHHLSMIFRKTGVSNRLELALFSLANDLVEIGATRRTRGAPPAKRHLAS